MNLNNGLIAYWPFQTDLEDHGPAKLTGTNHNVTLATGERAGAQFNGLDSFIEIPNRPELQWGTNDFSIAAWIETGKLTDVVGDLLSKFDSGTRRGWSFNVVTNTGVTTTSQANYRHLHFGIDNAKHDAQWFDCGRLGQAVSIFALATVQGHLYAGTFELEADQTGHLWRYKGGDEWEDVGATPDGSNSVQSITDYEGSLYCSTGRYKSVGSRLGPHKNKRPGGHVYRIENGEWIDCGVPGGEGAVPEEAPDASEYLTDKADEACALTVYRGRLYATSWRRRGAFVYEGGQKWKYVGMPERLMAFTVYRDQLYALVNGGPVYRYDGGEEWTYCGTPDRSTQTYAAATYKGELLVGTWPEGEVIRYDGGEEWTSRGIVGYEREVMAMALYNAKVYVGTLPMANIWRVDDHDYTYMGNVDDSPDYYLRRAWSMAVYQGKLYAGTLPSGRVRAFEAGRIATHDHALPAGRHHVAAIRHGNRLTIYLNGEQVAESSTFEASDFDLDNDQPLQIGFGPNQYFCGSMSDLRLYNRALTAEEIGELAGNQG